MYPRLFELPWSVCSFGPITVTEQCTSLLGLGAAEVQELAAQDAGSGDWSATFFSGGQGASSIGAVDADGPDALSAQPTPLADLHIPPASVGGVVGRGLLGEPGRGPRRRRGSPSHRPGRTSACPGGS